MMHHLRKANRLDLQPQKFYRRLRLLLICYLEHLAIPLMIWSRYLEARPISGEALTGAWEMDWVVYHLEAAHSDRP